MNIKDIENLVKQEYDIDDIFRNTRKANFVEARAVFFYILKNYTKMSYTNMGERYGFTHSTILHNVKNINNRLEYDNKLKKIVDKLVGKVNKS